MSDTLTIERRMRRANAAVNAALKLVEEHDPDDLSKTSMADLNVAHVFLRKALEELTEVSIALDMRTSNAAAMVLDQEANRAKA